MKSIARKLRITNYEGMRLTAAEVGRACVYEKGGEADDFSACDLRGSDLRGSDLLRHVFINADMRGVDLSYATLCCADLRSTSLQCANMRGTDLWHADLREAQLNCADLSGAYLGESNLIGAQLHGANLLGAELSDADRSDDDHPIEGWVVTEKGTLRRS